MNIQNRPRVAQSAKPNRSAARRDRLIVQNAETVRLRHEILLGIADEYEMFLARTDRETLSMPMQYRVSVWQRRARAIREAVELLGGERIG